MDQSEALILARFFVLVKSELKCYTTPETYTIVESEMHIELWGGNSQFSGVGISNCGHSTPDTDTKVQSELLRGVWGGHSQT